jgi:thiamine pyrophosphate-dependent acetolactate synthase large subunit-like protein
MIRAGQLLDRWLRVQGIDTVYGRSLPGLRVVEVGDAVVATRLALAHRRVNGVQAAAHTGDGRLLLDPVHGGAATTPTELTITDPGDLLEASATASVGPVLLRLDLDLTSPAPDVVPSAPPPVDRWTDPDPDHVKALTAARSPVVLAGPGVVDHQAAPGLNALAAAGSLGVLNTWGAKGVLDWRSRHHWATVGLQARDFELGGLGTADLIVATGVDAAEAPDARWQLAPFLDTPPATLGPLAEQWSRPHVELTIPPLRAALATVTQQGWAAEEAPLAPTRATLHYGQCVGTGGLVAADPGVSGYWVARTLPTTVLGTVQVPAEPDAAGFAPACALAARLRRPSRSVLAVVDGPPSPAVQAVLAAAEHLGVSIPVEVWHPSGAALSPADHLDRLRHLAVAERPEPVSLATDPTQLSRMVDAAGPITAWGGSVERSP